MKVRLPNKLVVEGTNRSETSLLFKEIFVEKVYAKSGIDLHEGSVVLDVGANIGMFALFLGQTLKDFTLYAFEPIPETFEMLRSNTSALSDKVRAFNLALADREGKAVFTYCPRRPSLSTCYPDELAKMWADAKDDLMGTAKVSPGARRSVWRRVSDPVRSLLVDKLIAYASVTQSRECPLMRLSDFLSDHKIDRVDLLKVDVEGSEWDVLRGVDDDDWGKIRQVVMEVNDVEGRVAGISEWLRERGFEVATKQEDWMVNYETTMLYARRTAL
jgi:FkbM family methyltransferase